MKKEEEMIVVPDALREQFAKAYENNHVIFFSAPCGMGKTAMAHVLTAQYKTIDTFMPGELPEEIPKEYECVIVDDFQMYRNEDDRQTIAAWMKHNFKQHFVFLSRGVLPGWLMNWQATGLLAVFRYNMLFMDKKAVRELFNRLEVSVTAEELQLICRETMGYAFAVSELAHRLASGEVYSGELLGDVERKLFYYLEENVYQRFGTRKRKLLLGLAPFERFDGELARLISGDSHVEELITELLHETTMFEPGPADSYRFWPIFRKFLLWELSQKCTQEQQNETYEHAGLYYELKDQYVNALWCYKQCGNNNKILQLLIKNGEEHPGTMHYYAMEQYYYDLPKEEILSSPELMSAMSMLTALSSDMEASEQWYQELQKFAAKLDKKDADYKTAKERLLFLDISLPQRGSANILELIGVAFWTITNKDWKMPEFSVTSTLPTIMNGGKDFCSWSKKDDMLYATMRGPVETVLGRDGVALADCAICESKFEKGEDVSERLLTIMTRMPEIQSKGTYDIEYAAMGLVIRQQTLHGKAEQALNVLEGLKERFEQNGQTRFFPNMDAMRCRVLLRLGRIEEAVLWFNKQAPAYLPRYQVLQRYQYMTAAMVQLARGKEEDALPYVTLFLPYCETCGRTMDEIYIHLITAVCRYRMKQAIWKEELTKALNMAQKYSFVTPIAQYGAAVLLLLTKLEWEKDKNPKEKKWFARVLAATREQTVLYPDFLRPPITLAEPLTPAEMQVLKLLCVNRTNQEIADILGVKMPTVKTHVRNILQKLGVSRRTEVKEAAVRLGLAE